jgi:hypothetical protein
MTKLNLSSGQVCAVAILAALAILGRSSNVHADVIFAESFNTDAANWKTDLGGTTNATWVNTGGADGGGYISRSFTPTGSGGSVVVLRGQDNFNSSNNGFVRDWIAAGVDHFSLALKTDSATPLNLTIRFAASPFPGAITKEFSLAASDQWTTVSIPIVDSLAVFQGYEGGTFEDVFGSMARIQLSIANAGTLPTTPFTISLDSPTISAVPEPATMTVLFVAMSAGAAMRLRKARQSKSHMSQTNLESQA